MRIREKFFKTVASMVTRHPGKILLGCAFITVAMLIGSSRLGIKTEFAAMLPEDMPQIQEYMDIIDDYSSDATVMITLESHDKDLKLMHEAAEELASRLQNVPLLKPPEGVKLSLGQKIALMQGKFPDEIDYDTLNLVRRIDYKLDNDFMSEHGLIIQKPKDLENTLEMFGSLELAQLIENINNNFEKEFIEDSDNLTTIDGEAQATQGLEGIRKFLRSIESYLDSGDSTAAAEAIAEFISGPQYMISSDNSMLLIMVQPSVSFNEFEDLMYLGNRIDDILDAVKEMYPGLEIGRTGMMMMQIDENNALANDFSWPTVIAIGIILVLLVGSFGTWKNPFFNVFTLVIGLIWTAGILGLVFQYLNMMSAGFAIILIGLGIDFGIHFISGFRDGQEHGKSVKDSIYYMYNRVGPGVITGAFTTAIVFFSLPLTKFEAYSQMGYVTGIGILTMLIIQMTMLPALIVWDNKGYSVFSNILHKLKLGFLVNAWNWSKKPVAAFFRLPVFRLISRPLRFGFLSSSAKFTRNTPVAISIIVLSAILAVLSIKAASSMEWEYDLMKLGPKDTPSLLTQNKILDKFEMSTDFAMVKAGDLDECRTLVEEFKKVGNRTDLISSVDAVTEFIPEKPDQLENKKQIIAFRERLNGMSISDSMAENDFDKLRQEFIRLHQNIVEIGELSIMSSGEKNKIIQKCDQIVGKTDDDSYILALENKLNSFKNDLPVISNYQKIAGNILRERLYKMTSTEIVTLENLPEDIRNRYVNKKNNDLLISVFPKGYIWEENSLITFNEQTERVSGRTTGMPVITQLLLDLMEIKGKEAMIIGAIAIVLFLLLDFRSFKYTFLAAIPLAVGASWMMGLVAATGMKMSLMNFVALPLIIGIGIDDGVHVLHRYRTEGRGSLPLVMKFTGRAILLTSLTTMIGFGSMSLASHTGIAIFGFTLFCGVGACFISSAYVLPAILSLMEKLTGKNRRSKKSPQSSKSDNVKTDTDENDQLKEETCA